MTDPLEMVRCGFIDAVEPIGAQRGEEPSLIDLGVVLGAVQHSKVAAGKCFCSAYSLLEMEAYAQPFQ